MKLACEAWKYLADQLEFPAKNELGTVRSKYEQATRHVPSFWQGFSVDALMNNNEKYGAWLGSLGKAAGFMSQALYWGAAAYHEARVKVFPLSEIEKARAAINYYAINNHLGTHNTKIAYWEWQYESYRAHNSAVMKTYCAQLQWIETNYTSKAVWWDLTPWL